MKKNDVLKQIVKQAKVKEAVNIEATIGGFVSPKSIRYRNAKNAYTPDVVVSYETKKDIFFIEDRLNKTLLPDMITKWILFSLEARKRKGKFYLMIPEKQKERFEQVIRDKQISAEIRTF